MSVLNKMLNIIPDSRWKVRANFNNLTICYSGKCPDYHFKIIESYDEHYDVNVKTNTKSKTVSFSSLDDLVDNLPVVLNDLDR